MMKVSHKKFAREFIIIMLSQISRSSKIILFDHFIASLDIAKIIHASKHEHSLEFYNDNISRNLLRDSPES